MRANTSPRLVPDPVINRELRQHAQQINALSEGRLVGTYNAHTGAPTTGTHARGDFVRNTLPADSGAAGNKHTVHGWLCILGGTPGTWLECRYMTDDVSAGSGGSPGGLTTEVQFNNAGAFDGNANLTINDATGVVTMGVDAVINGCGAGRGASSVATNTAFGAAALDSNAIGAKNTAFGCDAGTAITDGIDNTAIGNRALYTNNVGGYNTAVGSFAMGTGSAAFGTSNCTAIGSYALDSVTSGTANTAVGRSALTAVTSGQNNAAFGAYALDSATGSNNAAMGYGALAEVTSGSNNLAVGYIAGTEVGVRRITTASNEIAVGNNSHTAAYIKVAWTVTSDARDKTDFSLVPHGLDFVCALSSTRYRFKVSRDDPTPTGRWRYGFRAQDILAQEGPGGAVIDDSDPENLKYNESSLIPILVNAIQELRQQIEQLKGNHG